MNLGFDLDGVLYPFHKVLYDYLVMFHGLEDDYVTFWSDYESYYSEDLYSNLVKIETMYSKCLADKDIIDMLNRLNKENQIFYITCRPKEINFVTRNWLEVYKFPDTCNLIFTSNKLTAVCANHIEYYVEDRLQYAKELNNFTNLILVRLPHNMPDGLTFRNIGYVTEFENLLKEDMK